MPPYGLRSAASVQQCPHPCTVPGCSNATVQVTVPVLVTVEDSMGMPQEGIPVYVFDGATYTGFNGMSDLNGEVSFTLPVGDYSFRADSGGTQFWSGTANHCTIPGCLDAMVVVTVPVTVTVEDTNGVSQASVPIYAFDGSTYTGFTGTSDANGEVTLTLPEGSYRFRADYDGTQFWSGEAIPLCLKSKSPQAGRTRSASTLQPQDIPWLAIPSTKSGAYPRRTGVPCRPIWATICTTPGWAFLTRLMGNGWRSPVCRRLYCVRVRRG